MSLDLFTGNIDDAVNYAARVSAPELPSTFSDNFNDAWNKGYLTSQSISGSNRTIEARRQLVDDAIAKTGDQSLGSFISPDGSDSDFEGFNRKLAGHKTANPAIDVPPLSGEAIQARADDIGQRQLATSADLARRERTAGGTFGAFAGGAAAAFTDPVNLIAFPLAAPESLGILGTALAWGGIGAGSQAAIEALNASSMERIQPGYDASGQPMTNILEAGAGGAVLGGAIKGLASAWTRAKTGSWPRTVRDAGNVVESEAQIASTNPFQPAPVSELNLLHGYGSDVGFSGFKPLDQVSDAVRYDGGGGVFGRATYLDATGKWINGDNGALGINAAVRVKAKFDRLFVLTPDNPAALERIVGKDVLQNGTEIADALKAKGYDGIQVKGFDDLPQAEMDRFLSHFGTRMVEGDAYPNFDAGILQDQVAAFHPEKSLQVAGRVDLPSRPPIGATEADREAYFQKRRSVIGAEGGFLSGPSRLDPVAGGAAHRTALNKAIDDLAHGRPVDVEGIVTPTQLAALDERAAPVLAAKDAALEAQQAARAAAQEVLATSSKPPELPFAQTALEAQAELHTGTLTQGIQDIARLAGHDMPADEAAKIAARISQLNDPDKARAVLDEVFLRPQTIADTLPIATKPATNITENIPAEPAAALRADLTPAKIEEARVHPDLAETVSRDLDKLMLERPALEVPTGVTVDAEGRTVPTTRKVEDVVAEADARSAAAKEIEACVGPYPAGEVAA